MKPCVKNQKLIAWLALNALDARQAQALREHLATCEGCRRYLQEISSVTVKLAAADPSAHMQASESFHQRLAGKLRAAKPDSIGEILAAYFRGTLLNWRVAPPAIAALVVAVLVLATLWPRPIFPLPNQPRVRADPAPNLNRDMSPTFANYQKVANQSLEKLDDFLTEQGDQNLSPTPIYTASILPRANGSF